MYETALGTRVLYGAEERLFAGAVWSLTDQVRTFIDDSGEDHFGGDTGIATLETLTSSQIIVLIDRVSAYLLDRGMKAPTRTALLDATIAAIFHHVFTCVEIEIDWQRLREVDEEEDGGGESSTRARVVEAFEQTSDRDHGVVDTPDPRCTEAEIWQAVIQLLCERVLPDDDWQLESIALDSDPTRNAMMKQRMGIEGDYFIDTLPDVSAQEAATAWCNLIERITGWRPEPWRFGAGFPMPDDASMPPQHGLLSFAKDE